MCARFGLIVCLFIYLNIGLGGNQDFKRWSAGWTFIFRSDSNWGLHIKTALFMSVKTPTCYFNASFVHVFDLRLRQWSDLSSVCCLVFRASTAFTFCCSSVSLFFHFYCKLWRDFQFSVGWLMRITSTTWFVLWFTVSLCLILWTTEESWVVSVSTRLSHTTNAHLDRSLSFITWLSGRYGDRVMWVTVVL